MEFNEFIQWAFLGVVTGGVWILYQMKSSMNELNTNLAVIVERLEHHQEKLQGIEVRLRDIETRTSVCLRSK